MTTKMQAALDQLNRATGRTYSIWREGETFTLMMPISGSYPEADEHATMLRLVWMTIAADGRQACPVGSLPQASK